MKLDILITGVGGQGIILASDVLSNTAIAAGYDVKKTDTIGMAQRGGSVVSHVRIAEKVYSPLIKKGEADILLAFEKLEAARWSDYLKQDGVAIVNNHALQPLSVSLGGDTYPSDEEITGIIQKHTSRIHMVEGTKQAEALGNIRTLNIYMLGCLSRFTPIKADVWQSGISTHLKPKIVPINLKAFELGRKDISHGNC